MASAGETSTIVREFHNKATFLGRWQGIRICIWQPTQLTSKTRPGCHGSLSRCVPENNLNIFIAVFMFLTDKVMGNVRTIRIFSGPSTLPYEKTILILYN